MSVQDADIKLLRVFRGIAECGGFAQAQAHLGISLPSISMQVSALEQRLGVRLCDRGRGGFKLTTDGEQILAEADTLFHSLDQFNNAVRNISGKLVGKLVIGIEPATITSPGLRMADTLKRFFDKANDVNLTLWTLPVTDLQKLIIDGICQIGIGAFDQRVSGLVYEDVFVEEHLLYCGDRHRLFGISDEEIDLTDGLELGYAENELSRSSPKSPIQLEPRAIANSMESIAQLILSGEFVAYLPTHYAAQWAEENKMRAIKPGTFVVRHEFQIVTRKSEQEAFVTQKFLDDFFACQKGE